MRQPLSVPLLTTAVLLTVLGCCWEAAADMPSLLSDVKTFYRAASVMHFPLNATSNMSIDQIKRINLAVYEQQMAAAAAQDAEIIVFPESGTGYLAGPPEGVRAWCEPMPSPGWRATECSNSSSTHSTDGSISNEMLHAQWASCAAQKYAMDVVINFGYHDQIRGAFYNSDAAFNKYGFLLAIYRKSHINAAPYLKQPSIPDAVTFVSSFGVTFGMFTCFDLWFQEPMDEEMRLLNVTDFVHPNGMASNGPLMTIDQVHAGWSYVHQVNLVSAAMFPTGGAGAFHKGTVLAINPQQPFEAASYSVTVADVPIINRVGQRSGLSRRRDDAVAADASATAVVSEPQPHAASPSSSSPSQEFACFGGMASCAPFVPAPNTNVSLQASFTGPFATVQCTATIRTATASQHQWMLVAAQIDMVPQSSGTANANEAAFCIVMHCDTPESGCQFGAPVPAYWTSDLRISYVEVFATVSGGMNASSLVNYYPLYGFVNTTAVSPSSPFPLVFASTASVAAGGVSSNPQTPTYFIRVRDDDAVVEGCQMYSIGAYMTAKGS